jgi:hypothetical protein
MRQFKLCQGQLLLACVLASVVFAGIAGAAKPAKYRVPRNEYGQPDLSGVWNYSSDIPLERPIAMADRAVMTREELNKANAARDKGFEAFTSFGVGAHNTYWFDYRAQVENLRTSLITYPSNGRVPKAVDGVRPIGGLNAAVIDITGTHPVRFAVGGIGKNGPEDRGIFERCLGGATGPPILPSADNNFLQIVQGRNFVVLQTEHIHDARMVPMDGRPFGDERLRSWLGDSRGRWEGDTLVVVTKNFNDLTQSFNSYGTALHKVVTERFTRVAPGVVHYQATIDDPKTFTDKIELLLPMAKSDRNILEFACHEGNYSMPGILAGARKAERDALEKKP